MMKTISLKKMLTNLLISFLTAFVFVLMSYSLSDVYNNLEKPLFASSAKVLLIVWSILIFISGIASYFVRESNFIKKKLSLKLFYFCLVLNLLWPFMFFYLELFTLALVSILLLWIITILLAILFFIADKTAGKLMILYLIWLSYAVYLNVGLVVLN